MPYRVPSKEGRPRPDDPVLREVVRRLVQTYHPDRIYLFGSAARGDATEDSDYDLMVVVPDSTSPEELDWGRGHRALRGLGIAKDLLVWRRSDFDLRISLKSSLPAVITREGRLLYDR